MSNTSPANFNELDKELQNALTEVREWLLCGRGCAVFLGAAFSARSDQEPDAGGVPSSLKLREILKAEPREELSAVFQRLYHGDPGGLTRFLLKQFGGSPGPKPKQAHYQLARLPFRTVITTNCDGLMEVAYQTIWKDVARIVLDEDLPKVGTKDVTLIKPHGCVVEATSWMENGRSADDLFVFTQSQYESFSVRRPSLTQWLTAVLTTHHVLYLGYDISDEPLVKMLATGVGNKPLKRHANQAQYQSYAIMGDSRKSDFERFGFITNIKQVKAGAAEFVQLLVQEYTRALTHRRSQCEDLIKHTLSQAPKRFIDNCCLASLIDAFPLDLLTWRIKGDEASEAKQCFKNLYREGLVEPVMRLGTQWYRFHKFVLDSFQPKTMDRLKTGDLNVLDYEVFLHDTNKNEV